MPLAFCILAHKNPAQVRRLVEVLQGSENTCILHYDRRAPAAEHAAIRAVAADFSGVTVIPPTKVNWGRWSQMQAQLNMMRAALETPPRWTHLLTLSGQDFPLQAVDAIEAEYSRRPNESDIEWFDPFEPGRWKDARERLSRWHFDSDLLHRALRIPGIGRRMGAALGWQNRIPFLPGVRRKVPEFFRWFGGSNHHNLAREAVEYLRENPSARRIGGFLRRSGFPEESYVQSALLNSPSFAATLHNDDRRAIFWEAPDVPSPRILTMKDWPLLQTARASGKLFARKFDSGFDGAILHQLTRELSL